MSVKLAFITQATGRSQFFFFAMAWLGTWLHFNVKTCLYQKNNEYSISKFCFISYNLLLLKCITEGRFSGNGHSGQIPLNPKRRWKYKQPKADLTIDVPTMDIYGPNPRPMGCPKSVKGWKNGLSSDWGLSRLW